VLGPKPARDLWVMSAMPRLTTRKPAICRSASRSESSNQARSAVNSGIVPGSNAPICATGASCAPHMASRPKGKPPTQSGKASHRDAALGQSPLRTRSGKSTSAGIP
jgi:hypothetical protein